MAIIFKKYLCQTTLSRVEFFEINKDQLAQLITRIKKSPKI